MKLLTSQPSNGVRRAGEGQSPTLGHEWVGGRTPDRSTSCYRSSGQEPLIFVGSNSDAKARQALVADTLSAAWSTCPASGCE